MAGVIASAKRFSVRAARQGVKAAAAAADVVVRPQPGIVFLIYHRVGGASASEVDLPADVFRAQMAWLASSQRVMTIDTAVSRLVDPVSAAAGPDPVVVTFDDGTADWATVVAPILDDLQVPATFYVATSFVDQPGTVPGYGPAISWAGLGELVSTGLATIGSHTHSHALLDRVDPATAAFELDRSIGLIEDRLRVPCRHFAYPKALRASALVEPEVRARFASAALAGGRANRHGASDVWALDRTPVQRSDGMVWFKRKASGGLGFEGSLRTALSGGRYRGATT